MKMSRLFALLIALSVILSSGIFVSADEAETAIDFNTVDWNTVDLNDLDPDQLLDWIDTAELSALFPAYASLDGAYATKYWYELSMRIKDDFSGFVKALSKEDTETQQEIVLEISRGIYNQGEYAIKPEEFPDMVYAVKVSGSKQQQVLGLFKDAVEVYWGIPRTGDGLSVAVSAVCMASFACILLFMFSPYFRGRRSGI